MSIGGNVLTQARDLSSGTLGSLTGFSNYDQIYVVRLEFIEFCEENSTKYQTWAAAWNAFWPIFKGTQKFKSLL